jgi:hypothetical protein
VAKVRPTPSAIRNRVDEERLLNRHGRQNPPADEGGVMEAVRNSDITVAPQSFPVTRQLRDQLDSIVASKSRWVNLVEEE